MGETTIDATQLKFDKKNARKHSKRNLETIKKSLQQCGAGRSILIDENGEIIAGNGVIMANDGQLPVRVIDTDGTEIIAVRRTNLTTEQKLKLALYDNHTSDLSEWDETILTSLAEDEPDIYTDIFGADDALMKLMLGTDQTTTDADEVAGEEIYIEAGQEIFITVLDTNDSREMKKLTALDILSKLKSVSVVKTGAAAIEQAEVDFDTLLDGVFDGYPAKTED